MTKLYTPFGHWCGNCVVFVGVLFGLGFFLSEHCSLMGLCFCVYRVSTCIIKRHLNLDFINFFEQVCVVFLCVKHVSSAYQDTDGTPKKPKKPARQKHFVYHHTSVHTHTKLRKSAPRCQFFCSQGANFFAHKSLKQWRWLKTVQSSFWVYVWGNS